jgi:hypothetical protein
MIETGLWELHKAIYVRLSQDAELNNLVSGVYDKVGEDTLYPYVTVGEPTVTPQETKTSYIENIPWVLHAFSQYSGKKQSYDILNAMVKALTRKPWDIPGFTVHNFKIEPNMQVITDIDGQTYHSILRVRFFIEKN